MKIAAIGLEETAIHKWPSATDTLLTCPSARVYVLLGAPLHVCQSVVLFADAMNTTKAGSLGNIWTPNRYFRSDLNKRVFRAFRYIQKV